MRQEVNILERERKGELHYEGKRKYEGLEKKYGIRRTGLSTVLEELKQRMIAKSAKMKRYEQRIAQYRQNRLFQSDQKKFYNELNGSKGRTCEVPDAGETRRFWSDIRSTEKQHNKNAEWLKNLKVDQHQKQQKVVIDHEKVTKQCRKISNWKAPGKDGVQGFWLKKLTNIHKRIAQQFNLVLEGTVPEWMTYGRTVLCQKDPTKGTLVDNYRPITCLPLMGKLFTGIIADDIYHHLSRESLLPEEQKGCRRMSRGTKDQLLIDKTILQDCKRRHTNLAMAWIDYRKAFDFVPHSWICECLEMFGIAENVRQFLANSMKNWKLTLTANGTNLGEVKVTRGIFQGDSLSPLLFVICMIPLSLVLRKTKAFYEWGNKQYRINHLLFMDDLKLFGKTKDQIDSLVQTVQIFSEDIGMEFGLKKCGILVLRKGKLIAGEGIHLPNDRLMKEVTEEGYTYLGILELDKIKEREIKKNIDREYKRRLRLILKSKLNGRNKIIAINTWAVALLRYGAGIIDWNCEELRSLDRNMRKYMTIYGALHPKSDVQRLYLGRKEGGRGLIGCEECVRGEENCISWYVKNSNEKLIEGVRKSGIVDFENSVRKDIFKRERKETLKRNWREKQMYGQFLRDMPDDVDQENSWMWLLQSGLKASTEALICAAQEQAIRSNSIKYSIDRTTDSPLCRMCGVKVESVRHIISGCEKLAQKE